MFGKDGMEAKTDVLGAAGAESVTVTFYHRFKPGDPKVPGEESETGISLPCRFAGTCRQAGHSGRLLWRNSQNYPPRPAVAI